MKASRTRVGMLMALASVLYFTGPCRLVAQLDVQTSTTLKVSGSPNWNVLVDRISPGETNIDPAFQAAIYENLIEELAKTKRFNQVLRDGDHNASEGSDVLILKTTVEKYKPGSETRRAVTTFTGATKLRVDNQLCTKDGQVIFQSEVDGNVRFLGGNLRATHNLARHVAAKLKHATLPNASVQRTNQPSSRGAAAQSAHIWTNHEVPESLADGNASAAMESEK